MNRKTHELLGGDKTDAAALPNEGLELLRLFIELNRDERQSVINFAQKAYDSKARRNEHS